MLTPQPRQFIYGNPLAFPVGRLAGLDPTHPAAFGCTLSAVNTGKGVFDLIQNQVGVVSNTPLFQIFGVAGPIINANSSGWASFSGRPTTAPTQVTMVVIGLAPANPCTLLGTSGRGSAVGYGLRTLANGDFMLTLNNNVHYTDPVIVLTANVPYFLFASLNTASGTLNYVIRNLANGSIRSAVVTGATSVATAGNGTYVVVSDSTTNTANGIVAAAYISNQFMSLQTGLQWAADPWSFWYPIDYVPDWVGAVAAAPIVPIGNTLTVMGVG